MFDLRKVKIIGIQGYICIFFKKCKNIESHHIFLLD